MKRLLSVLILIILIGGVLVYAFRKPLLLAIRYEPIVADQSGIASQALPTGTVVVSSADIDDVTAPIERRRDLSASGGYVLILPEGAGDSTSNGVARFIVQVPQAGTYHSWIRTRWSDECANSCRLQVGGDREFIVGQDAIYDTWHWVRAGEHVLTNQAVEVALAGREDGIAIDQVIFTPDPTFAPSGNIRGGKIEPGVRRFADNFDRSPGHGLEPWSVTSGEWNILFDLDPNRIPLQYALRGAASSETGQAEIRAGSEWWDGLDLRTRIHMPPHTAAGVVLTDDEGSVTTIQLKSATKLTELVVTHGLQTEVVTLPDPQPCNQWYALTVERWAWLLLVYLDDQRIYTEFNLEPGAVQAGLQVHHGDPTFDDVAITEILWVADAGGTDRIAWQPAADAKWYRPRQPSGGPTLFGRRGALSAPANGLTPMALWIQEETSTPSDVLPVAETEEKLAEGRLVQFPRSAPPAMPVNLATKTETRIERVAIAYGRRARDVVRLGPYHFSERLVEDPSDYLDFTEEELHEIRTSAEADKLRRRPRERGVVGRGYTDFWRIVRGLWLVQDGTLRSTGPGAELRHWLDVVSDMTVSFRVRLTDAPALGGLTVYGDAEHEIAISFGDTGPDLQPPASPQIPIAADGEWHSVRIRFDASGMRATLDGEIVSGMPESLRRGHGGRIHLKAVRGVVFFDDITIEIPRRASNGMMYAFDRRESDWLRSGSTWIDHGGIACVLASSWISMASPQASSYIWNKRQFGPDVMLVFSVEEYSHWYGWKAEPSHVHYPFDNITAVLGTARDPESGYRLEVNAANRSRTILYRDGEPVAECPQDRRFPVRHIGGHAPYTPRRMRIALAKENATVYAYVEGVEVLAFTDPNPLDVSTVGLGGYETHANFSHVAVRNLSQE